jgi:outer membrane protein
MLLKRLFTIKINARFENSCFNIFTNYMKQFLLLLFILFNLFVKAQPVLTLSNAVNIAMQKNFDIQLSKNAVAAATENNHRSIAGANPTATLTISDQESMININQKLNTGVEITRNNATSNQLVGNATISMLLYNGNRVVATKKRLEQLQAQSQQQLNAQIQNTLAAVHTFFYDIVRQQAYIKALQQTIAVNEQQLQLIEVRKSVGMANNADLFQAQLDLNNRKQDLQTQELIVKNTKADLFTLLAIKPDTLLQIIDTIIVEKNMQLATIINSLSTNPAIQSINQQILINQQIEKEVTALRYPSIRANSGLNYFRNQAAGGQLLLNQNYGPFLNVGISFPFYNGGAVKRQEKIANINTQGVELQKQNTLVALENNVVKAYQTYTTNTNLMAAQQQNVTIALQLVQLALQRYELGQATIIELREAQRSYEDAAFKFINISFAAKVAEITLKQIANKLGI